MASTLMVGIGTWLALEKGLEKRRREVIRAAVATNRAKKGAFFIVSLPQTSV
jgi:hypothetical protein